MWARFPPDAPCSIGIMALRNLAMVETPVRFWYTALSNAFQWCNASMSELNRLERVGISSGQKSLLSCGYISISRELGFHPRYAGAEPAIHSIWESSNGKTRGFGPLNVGPTPTSQALPV